MRHFDQSWQAVAGLDVDLETRLDVITAVDEYVFGFCLHERNNLRDDPDDDEMMDYISALLIDDEYPALAAMVDEMGLAQVWSRMDAHARGTGRFDRNLARLLNGFEASLPSR
jgi:Tetracyclin repressor-like, C-terminal domain